MTDVPINFVGSMGDMTDRKFKLVFWVEDEEKTVIGEKKQTFIAIDEETIRRLLIEGDDLFTEKGPRMGAQNAVSEKFFAAFLVGAKALRSHLLSAMGAKVTFG